MPRSEQAKLVSLDIALKERVMQWGYNLCITGARASRFNRHTAWHIKNEFALKRVKNVFNRFHLDSFFCVCASSKWTIERLIIILFFPTTSPHLSIPASLTSSLKLKICVCSESICKRELKKIYISSAWMWVRDLSFGILLVDSTDYICAHIGSISSQQTTRDENEREREKVMRIKCVEAHRDGHATSSFPYICDTLLLLL